MTAQLCPNCFGSDYRNGFCSSCGYRLQNDHNASGRNLSCGSILHGRYYVGRVLGTGGFGITYKAYDIPQRKVCCVKEYAPADMCQRSQDGRLLSLLSPSIEKPYYAGLKRFMDESQILSRLENIPSVVNITDTFQENHTAYFVMEYLDGADLKKVVQASEGHLPVQWVVDITIQVALSLGVIHMRTGIIHRDISPENIYITQDGRVKLIDFGSAKRTENGVKSGLSIVLKPKYAPPEQFSSEQLQGTFTDVYALASTCYYALTGTNVPPAPDRLAGKTYPPLKELKLGVSAAVSDAVDHALLLNVKKRTPDMQTLVAEMVADTSVPEENRRVIPYVVLRYPGHPAVRYHLAPGQAVRIGRSRTADIFLETDDCDISRIHCEVTYEEQRGVFCVQDLSMNGLYFGNTRLQKDILYQVSAPAVFWLAKKEFKMELGKEDEHQA